jgi:nicotinic acid mononucleotide adenylyltransferase
MTFDIAEVARSLELYNLAKDLVQEKERGNKVLEFTREAPRRRKRDVSRVVVAFGSYDPLSVAHEKLFLRGLETARASDEPGHTLDELLIVTSTHHFEKGVDLKKNAAIYDRIHAQEGFASCIGNVSLAFFNHPLFVDLLPSVEQCYSPQTKVYFVIGSDVLEKIVDVKENEKRGKDTAEVLQQLFKQYFIVSDREVNYRDRPSRHLDVPILLQENPLLQPYANRIIPITLEGEYPNLEIPIDRVSSTLIRDGRSRGEDVSRLEAVGISGFVDKRDLYVQSSLRYEAFVCARQMFADYFRAKNQSIGAYINQLMTFLEEMNNSSTLQKIVIQCYSNQEFPSVILGE